jgi:hypothetical protein
MSPRASAAVVKPRPNAGKPSEYRLAGRPLRSRAGCLVAAPDLRGRGTQAIELRQSLESRHGREAAGLAAVLALLGKPPGFPRPPPLVREGFRTFNLGIKSPSERSSLSSRSAPSAEKSFRSEQQCAPLPRVARSDPRVAKRRGPQAPHARLTAQRPLPSDYRVVVKRGERQPLRPSPASARGLHGRERLACAQRIEAEVPCSASHPAGMPPRST